MLPKPHALFSEETFEFWDFFHTICKMIVVSKKRLKKKSKWYHFSYEIQFLSKDLHWVFSSLLYILFYPDKYNWNKWRQFIRKLAKNLQSLLMKLLKAISISVFIQIVLLHVSLNFFLNNFLNFFVSFYTILQESFHKGNCWLL